jgi:hypothetical protein
MRVEGKNQSVNFIGIEQPLMVTAADVVNALRFQREIGLALQSVMTVELYRL